MPSLQILKGPNEGTLIPLEGERFILGRNPDCAVVIPVTSVSREHAQIVRISGKYFIEDKQSRNGTFVNNQAINTRTALKNNDRIRICDFIAAFLDQATVPDAEPDDDEADDGPSDVERLLNHTSHLLLETQPAEKLRLLVEISGNLSRTLELNTLLSKIADSLFQVFRQADRCFLIVAEGDRLNPRVVKTRRAADEGNARFSKSIVRGCLKEGKAFLTDDASRDERIQLSQSVVDFRIRSVMCAPLTRGGPSSPTFPPITSEAECRALRDSLEVNHILHQQAEAFGLQEALADPSSRARQILGAGFHRLVVLDADRGRRYAGGPFELDRFLRHVHDQLVREYDLHLPPGTYHLENLAQVLKDEPRSLFCFLNIQLVSPEEQLRLRGFAQELHQVLFLCRADARTDGKAFGVIQLDTQDRSKKFTEEDLKLLCGVANQASIALENARLLDDAVKQERLQRDLKLAKEVQASFLPSSLPLIPGYEFHAHHQAALDVGGDYHGYIPLPGGRLCVAVGGVPGKGVNAALLMARLSSDIRFAMLSDPSPASAVGKLNDLMYEYTSKIDRFVTLAVAVLDPATHEAVLVSAGHDPPLLYRPASGELMEAMPRDAAGVPLGIMAGFLFESSRITLEPGDCLLLLTDGVADSRSVTEAEFTDKGVRSLFQGVSGLGPKDLVTRLVTAVHKHTAGRDLFDDLTIVALGRRDE